MAKIIKFEYKKQPQSFNMEGWFNATEAAARFNKRPVEWMNQRDTVEYLAALYEQMGGKSDFLQQFKEISVLDGDSASSRAKLLRLAKKTGLVYTKSGPAEIGGGTWFHPKLAVAFARWLDIKFAVWCDMQIDAIIRNGLQMNSFSHLIPLLLRPDVAEWELRFHDEYYHALARITGTKYTGHSGGTPAIYGNLTDKWVYGCILPQEVYAELKARKHQSEKMHQWLTDGGKAELDKQIQRVTDIAASSNSLQDFESRMNTIMRKCGQLSIAYTVGLAAI